ncbi:MAG: hypothetical protein SPI59_03995 [Finegoldia sp.]|nr:hypothetical protein [Finegoldia sp.]
MKKLGLLLLTFLLMTGCSSKNEAFVVPETMKIVDIVDVSKLYNLDDIPQGEYTFVKKEDLKLSDPKDSKNIAIKIEKLPKGEGVHVRLLKKDESTLVDEEKLQEMIKARDLKDLSLEIYIGDSDALDEFDLLLSSALKTVGIY